MTVTYEAVLAAHYNALSLGEIPPLLLFVDGVLVDLDDGVHTFDDEPSNHCADVRHIGGCPCRIGGDVVFADDESRLRART